MDRISITPGIHYWIVGDAASNNSVYCDILGSPDYVSVVFKNCLRDVAEGTVIVLRDSPPLDLIRDMFLTNEISYYCGRHGKTEMVDRVSLVIITPMTPESMSMFTLSGRNLRDIIRSEMTVVGCERTEPATPTPLVVCKDGRKRHATVPRNEEDVVTTTKKTKLYNIPTDPTLRRDYLREEIPKFFTRYLVDKEEGVYDDVKSVLPMFIESIPILSKGNREAAPYVGAMYSFVWFINTGSVNTCASWMMTRPQVACATLGCDLKPRPKSIRALIVKDYAENWRLYRGKNPKEVADMVDDFVLMNFGTARDR